MARSIREIAARRHTKEQLIHVQIVVDRPALERGMPVQRIRSVFQRIGEYRLRIRLTTTRSVTGFVDQVNPGTVFLVSEGISARNEYGRRRVDLLCQR